MNQGNRRHGGRGYTLLYYIGLEGKEGGRRRDRTAQVARCTGQGKGGRRTEEQKKDKRNGKQKDRRTEKKEDRRTEKRKGNGKQKDKGTEKRAGNLQLPSLFDATNFVTVLYGDFSLLY